jgi:multidrug efflux pump subunit AcrA (membrane-fusion protein)
VRKNIAEFQGELEQAQRTASLAAQGLNRPDITPEERRNFSIMQNEAEVNIKKNKTKLEILRRMAGGEQYSIRSPIDGRITTFDVTELRGKTVKAGDKLLEVAKVDGQWEVHLNIPEMHVGKIREALANSKDKQLDVRLWISTDPNTYYEGKLHEDGLGGKVEHVSENESTLLARVEIGDDLRKALESLQGQGMPVEVMVQAKVNCGLRPIGYVWFYQLWEFFFEHVVF